jgi:hypothetical protein
MQYIRTPSEFALLWTHGNGSVIDADVSYQGWDADEVLQASSKPTHGTRRMGQGIIRAAQLSLRYRELMCFSLSRAVADSIIFVSCLSKSSYAQTQQL